MFRKVAKLASGKDKPACKCVCPYYAAIAKAADTPRLARIAEAAQSGVYFGPV